MTLPGAAQTYLADTLELVIDVDSWRRLRCVDSAACSHPVTDPGFAKGGGPWQAWSTSL